MLHKYTCLLVGWGVAVLISQPSTAWAQLPRTDVLSIAMRHTGNFTVGVPGVYSIVVSNISGTAFDGGSLGIDVEDNLTQTGFRYVSATGAGWSCGVSYVGLFNTQYEVLCESSGVIAAGGSAPAITLTVLPTVSGTVSNAISVLACPASVCVSNFATDPTIVVAAVPTLPEWAMIALSTLLLLAGFAARRPLSDVSGKLTW
jgi:IPTL-CTERM motif